jgi:hypothetical protein
MHDGVDDLDRSAKAIRQINRLLPDSPAKLTRDSATDRTPGRSPRHLHALNSQQTYKKPMAVKESIAILKRDLGVMLEGV